MMPSRQTILAMVFLLLCAIAAVWTLRVVEPVVAPVVDNFTVTDQTRDKGELFISGHMDKKRPCEFKGLAIYAITPGQLPRLLAHQYLNDVINSPQPRPILQSRATGVQQWGPIQITLPFTTWGGYIQVYSTHSCWSYWLIETDLATFAVPAPIAPTTQSSAP